MRDLLKHKFDIQSPALQAVVDDGTLSASYASLAYGYEDKDLRVNYTDANHFQLFDCYGTKTLNSQFSAPIICSP
jgi:hypothetical protein